MFVDIEPETPTTIQVKPVFQKYLAIDHSFLQHPGKVAPTDLPLKINKNDTHLSMQNWVSSIEFVSLTKSSFTKTIFTCFLYNKLSFITNYVA